MGRIFRIGIDADDILFPYVPGLLNFSNKKYGTKFKPEMVLRYDFSFLGKDPEEAKRKMDEFVETPEFRAAEPLEGALEGIKRFFIQGYILSVVSGRRESLRSFTEERIARYFPGQFSGIYLTNQFQNHGPKTTKANLARELNLDFIIEDALENALPVAESGTSVLILDYPWNRFEYALPEGSGKVYRGLKSWSEINNKVDQLALIS